MANEKRLVDANALKETLQAHYDFFVDAWGGFSNLPQKDKARVDEITHCIAEICNAPTVDAVEVVHGRWEYYSTTMQECSNCKRHTARHRFKYCPHCGAVMEDKYNDG